MVGSCLCVLCVRWLYVVCVSMSVRLCGCLSVCVWVFLCVRGCADECVWVSGCVNIWGYGCACV